MLIAVIVSTFTKMFKLKANYKVVGDFHQPPCFTYGYVAFTSNALHFYYPL